MGHASGCFSMILYRHRPEDSQFNHSRTLPETEFAFLYQDQVLSRFTLPAGEYIIGRGVGCKIAIDIDGIAPRHARLVVGERLILEDLGSELGIFFRGVRLYGAADLDTGSAVQLGSGGTLRVENRPETAMPVAVP